MLGGATIAIVAPMVIASSALATTITSPTGTHSSGIKCTYTTGEALTLGAITGGSPATLHFNVSVPRHGGSLLCGGSNSNVTGTYRTTNAYYIDS